MKLSLTLGSVLSATAAALVSMAPVVAPVALADQPNACETEHGAADGTPCGQDDPTNQGPAQPGLTAGPNGDGADAADCIPGRVCNNGVSN
jgi:hypothetical protein